jgi:hypothetical protein
MSGGIHGDNSWTNVSKNICILEIYWATFEFRLEIALGIPIFFLYLPFFLSENTFSFKFL